MLYSVNINESYIKKRNLDEAFYSFVWQLIHVKTWKQWIAEDYKNIYKNEICSEILCGPFNFYLAKKIIMYSIHRGRLVCAGGLHSRKGHQAQQANKGDAGCDLGWISPEPHQHAAKTNSRWWFASCLRSLWPASRQQSRDPQCSEGGAKESSPALPLAIRPEADGSP